MTSEAQPNATPLVSVVIPCYRSAATIEEVVALTRKVLLDQGYDYEFVLVNYGSPDDTFAHIRRLCDADPRVKGIDLVRNFGQHGAIMAGLNVMFLARVCSWTTT